MNRNFKTGGAILLLTLAVACNKKAEETPAADSTAVDTTAVVADTTAVVADTAAVKTDSAATKTEEVKK